MGLGVQFERYWVWADPRRLPPGAKVADPKLAQEIRRIVESAYRVLLSPSTRVLDEAALNSGRRWLTYHGPSARRSVLVVLEAPARKPTRFWHASVEVRTFRGGRDR